MSDQTAHDLEKTDQVVHRTRQAQDAELSDQELDEVSGGTGATAAALGYVPTGGGPVLGAGAAWEGLQP